MARRETDLGPDAYVRWWPQTFQRAGLVVCVRVCSSGSAGPRGAGVWFVTHRRAKALVWPLAWTGGGDALGRRILLEGVVEVVVSIPHPGSSRGNPRSHAGSGEVDTSVSFAS